MIAKQVLKYLENQGYGVEGTNLFYDFLPDNQDNCITLYDESVPTSPESNCLSVDNSGLHVVVRNTNTDNAKNISWNIHKLLVGLGGNDFKFDDNGNIISYVTIETSPFSTGKDSDGRANYSAHYNIRFMSNNDNVRL